MAVSKKIRDATQRASWVRKMFEEGAVRKAQYGAENVFDFSLGNPNLEPPEKVKAVLMKLCAEESSGTHGYMSNAGFVETRSAVADYLGDLNNFSFGPGDIVMTVGAAGGLNVILKTILDPGDEVIIPAPYFVEYNFYVDNFGGIPKIVTTKPDFSLDLLSIEKALSSKTKALLINNPNNPTGRVYKKEELKQVADLLTHYSQRFGEPIYVISDEPYSKIVYNHKKCPSMFDVYQQSVLVTSFSKDLSLPGERIGYIAVHPQIAEKDLIVEGLVLSNRILGFVNAPALMQRLIPFLLGESVDISRYKKKRDILCTGLKALGYQFSVPEGAFYLFPESPIPDDVAFVSALQEENILTVPGFGFGCPKHFRIAYCVEDDVIEKSLPGFSRVMDKIQTERL